jgi:hypothetical protein
LKIRLNSRRERAVISIYKWFEIKINYNLVISLLLECCQPGFLGGNFSVAAFVAIGSPFHFPNAAQHVD